MTYKKIYLTRHGRTDFNRRGIVQGSGVDADLDELGQRQAAAFFEHYGNLPLKRVYTSGLRRTHQSVERFLKSGLAHEALEELNEIHWGEQEGVEATPESRQYYQEIVKAWAAGETEMRITGGESPKDVAVRMKLAMEKIMAKEEEDVILICMHGRAMRVMLCLLLNYDLRHMDLFEHRNLGLYTLVYTGSMYRLEGFNEGRHLEGVGE